MKMFNTYVLPKIDKSISYGVNSCIVSFDEVMNPSLFNEINILQLKSFIENFKISKGVTKVNLNIKEWFGGKRFTLSVYW